MALKIITSFVILVAVAMGVFSTMKFGGDVQMQVARTAYKNKEISTALVYARKAMFWNPTEQRYWVYTDKIQEKYKLLKAVMAKGGNKK